MNKSLLLLPWFLTLVACVPRLQDPPPVLTSLVVPAPAGPGLTPAWWSIFHDPCLQTWLTMAWHDNLSLAQAHARMQAAQYRIDQAGAQLWPHAQAHADLENLRNSYNGARAIYNGQTYDYAAFSPLDIDYHLDFWGEYRDLTAIASDQAQLAQASERWSRLLLTAALIKTYFAWQSAAWLLERQQRLLDLATTATRISRSAVQAGTAPLSQLLAQQGERDKILAQQRDLQQRYAALQWALMTLIGQAPSVAPPPTSLQVANVDDLPLPQRIDLDRLASRPDIQMALWRVRAAAHRQKFAVTQYYPNIDLRAMLGFDSIGLDRLLSARSSGYALGPAIHLPIFEGGALDAQYHASAADYAAAVYAYNDSLLHAAQAVATDLSQLQQSRYKLEDLKTYRHRQTRLLAIAQRGFDSGITARQELVSAERATVIADIAYLQERLLWLDALTDTATDLGGGE